MEQNRSGEMQTSNEHAEHRHGLLADAQGGTNHDDDVASQDLGSPEPVYRYEDSACGHYEIDHAAQARFAAQSMQLKRKMSISAAVDARNPSKSARVSAFIRSYIINTSTLFTIVLGVSAAIMASFGNTVIWGLRLGACQRESLRVFFPV
jgi:hypothetical protein